VAVHFVPVTAVAGDLYDFVRLDPARTGILVADVSGHGIPAALVASMVKLAFTTAADESHDPAQVLSAINRALCRQLELGLVTAVYVVIDTERGSATFANGGHPPPLVGRADGQVEAIQEHGLLLGFKPDVAYKNVEIPLRDGDLLLLYTDGVTEARNAAGEFFDRDRLAGWLAARGDRQVAPFMKAAVAELDRWRGDRAFEDDVTFVVARYAPGPLDPPRSSHEPVGHHQLGHRREHMTSVRLDVDAEPLFDAVLPISLARRRDRELYARQRRA
jgi:serine phosphatase RsbU (regulator of sigma subunit)